MHTYISFRFGKLFHSWNGREKMARSSVIGGRSGIIWILIFMIHDDFLWPTVFIRISAQPRISAHLE